MFLNVRRWEKGDFKSTPLLSHFPVLHTNTYMHVVQMLDACKLIRSHVHASAHTLCFSLSLSLPVYLFLSVVQEREIERCRQKQSVLVFASTRSCIHTGSFSIKLEYQLCELLCVCCAACGWVHICACVCIFVRFFVLCSCCVLVCMCVFTYVRMCARVYIFVRVFACANV